MDKQTFVSQCDYFNMVHAVTLRAIEAFGDGDLDFRPQPGMRSPRDLVFHLYGQEKILAEAARQGKFTAEAASRSNPEDRANAAELEVLTTGNDLESTPKRLIRRRKAYFRRCRKASLIVLSNRRSAPIQRGGISGLPTTSTGITEGSFTPIFGYWGKNPRCCTTTEWMVALQLRGRVAARVNFPRAVRCDR